MAAVLEEIKLPQAMGSEARKEAFKDLMWDIAPLAMGMMPFPSTMIKAPRGQAEYIRRLFRDEMKARGPSPKGLKGTQKMINDFLRGSFYHGRKTFPARGTSFDQARLGTGNLGEPKGLSLTASPELLESAFAQGRSIPQKLFAAMKKAQEDFAVAQYKQYDNLQKLRNGLISPDEYKTLISRTNDEIFAAQSLVDKLSETQTKLRSPRFARVLPRFGGDPMERVLPTWQAPENAWAHKVLKEAYVEGLKRQPGLWKPATHKLSSRQANVVKQMIGKNPEAFAPYVYKLAPRSMMSELSPSQMRDYLREGQDFIKHAITGNAGEEMRDAFVTFVREQAPKFYEEIVQGKKLIYDPLHRLNQPQLNRDISEILLSKGYKGLMHGVERYKGQGMPFGEAELRMLDPKDVLMVDFRTHKAPGIKRLMEGRAAITPEEQLVEGLGIPSSTKRLFEYWNKTSGLPASLRDIYETIDLNKLRLE